MPTVTDNVPATVNVVSDKVNGATVHIGETITVTFTATDPSGNNDTCQFTATVIGT